MNIKRTLREELESYPFNVEPVTLYHRISGRKLNMDMFETIKSVMKNGLIPYDNGEVGSVIWFSNNFNDYAKNSQFVVSIEYNNQTRDKYDIAYDGRNGYVAKPIPFKDLNVIKIPVGEINNYFIDNKEVIEKDYLNNSDTMNQITEDIILYRNLFNEYVQPYINEKNYLEKINNPDVKIIDF